MRALVADGAAPGRIALDDVPEPIVAPGDVLVDVRAVSLNRGEMRMLGTAADGWRPGWDFAGVLHSDGPGGLRAGARVLGIGAGGSWAQSVAAPAGWVAALPDTVTFAQAAALPTLWRSSSCERARPHGGVRTADLVEHPPTWRVQV